jgi:peptide/nickel transport system substrate-binding protein
MTLPSRRSVLALGFAGAGALLWPAAARAMGRKPYGGTLRMKLPWPLDVLDPHVVEDAAAALFGPAIADPLFAMDPLGRPYPALAAALPEPTAGGTRVTLRPNLVSGRGAAMDARDVLFSLSRTESRGGAALLAASGKPTPDPGDPLAVLFPARDPSQLAVLLASPLTAIVPRRFSRTQPDGTGAFVADISRDRLVLRRNANAARGASFLDRIEVSPATDLRDALRAFEAGETDVSWLGEFLHKPRPGAQKYDAGIFGWVVLRTGKDAGSWGAPGVAQRLLDALPSGRLAHLGLSATGGGASGDAAWGGDAAEVLVVEGATHLEQIGRELAAILSRPGHELRVSVRPRGEVEYRRARGRYSLALDFVRPVGSGDDGAELGLLTAVAPAMARKPPHFASQDPRVAARSLPLAVVGDLKATGASIGALHDVAAWDLGAVWRR